MRMRKQWREWGYHLYMVGPAIICLLVVIMVPFAMGGYYSLTSWNGISGEKSWVGWDNYIRIFTEDVQFFNSFKFTLQFTAVSLVLTNLLAFVLALGLTQALKTVSLLRASFFVPNVLGGILLGFIWRFIFTNVFADIGEQTGIGLFGLQWLGTSSTGFWAMIIVYGWLITGYLMIIYVTALQGLDPSILEAAKIDGTSYMQSLFRIVLPLVVPAFTICLFLSLSIAFKVFDLNLALTNGGPFNSTQMVAHNIYAEAFQKNRFGLGSAKAFLFFVAVALLSLAQVMFTRKREVSL